MNKRINDTTQCWWGNQKCTHPLIVACFILLWSGKVILGLLDAQYLVSPVLPLSLCACVVCGVHFLIDIQLGYWLCRGKRDGYDLANCWVGYLWKGSHPSSWALLTARTASPGGHTCLHLQGNRMHASGLQETAWPEAVGGTGTHLGRRVHQMQTSLLFLIKEQSSATNNYGGGKATFLYNERHWTVVVSTNLILECCEVACSELYPEHLRMHRSDKSSPLPH